MINKQLLNPSSIVVVGGSDDIQKPGGKVLKNLIDGHFKGSLYVVNPKMPSHRYSRWKGRSSLGQSSRSRCWQGGIIVFCQVIF